MVTTSDIDINFNNNNHTTIPKAKNFSYTLKPNKSSLKRVSGTAVANISCSSLITNPQKFIPPTSKKLKLRESWLGFRGFAKDNDVKRRRKTPFPTLRWAEKQEMWDLMCKKENSIYKRLPGDQILLRHTAIQPKMRAILLDWLTEVCQEYLLHRETFYLAVDFIDRYLGSITDVPKTSLQSVGVTCLFIASKLEEIYPPKLNGFAFYTDGACSEDEILEMELVILKKLNWGLAPITPNRWMKTYMQLHDYERTIEDNKIHDREERTYNADYGNDSACDIMRPIYTGRDFIQAMQLLDLVILDLGCMSYSYSVLVASIFYYFQGQEAAISVSGYSWKEICPCVEWIAPFALALRDSNKPPLVSNFPGVQKEDQHNIQTHSVDLALLEQAQAYQQQDLIEADPEEDENTCLTDEESRENDSKENLLEDIPAGDIEDYNIKQDMKNIHIKSNATNDIHISAKDFYGSRNGKIILDPKVEKYGGAQIIPQYYKQRK